MPDSLKSAIDRARAAGMTGLVCGVCLDMGSVDGIAFNGYGDTHKAAVRCPACDGTGYPSAGEALMWVVMRQLAAGKRVTIGQRSVWVDDSGFDYHDGTPDRLAAEALNAVTRQFEEVDE